MNENNEQVQTNHTRMNFGMNAKGLVQLDVTVNYETPGIAAEHARKALIEYKAICEEQGLKLADSKPAT